MNTDSKKYSTYDDFMKCITDTLAKRTVKLVAPKPNTKPTTYTKEEFITIREAVARARKEREQVQSMLGVAPSKVEHRHIGGETHQEIKPKTMRQLSSTGGRMVFAAIPDK